MKTHSDFFSFRKLEKMNNSLSIKYTQIPTFIPKKNNFHKYFLNKSKNKQNKRYFLNNNNNNNNRIPKMKQNNIKSFSLNKRPIKLENCFHLSNSNFHITDPLIKSNNNTKNLKLISNTINNNHIKHSSKTIPKNEMLIDYIRTYKMGPKYSYQIHIFH